MSDDRQTTVWMATKAFRVRRKGATVMLKVGDEVPEAFYWPNVDYWEARGFLRKLNRRPKDADTASAPSIDNKAPLPKAFKRAENEARKSE
jgi:hypothetical protein